MAAAGFERPDGFVNHGAMACEALAVLGCPGGIDSWARRFAAAGGASVDPVVPAGFGWRQALGDYRRPACLTRCQHRGHRPPVPRFRFRLPDAVAGNASSACFETGLAVVPPMAPDPALEACLLQVTGQVTASQPGVSR